MQIGTGERHPFTNWRGRLAAGITPQAKRIAVIALATIATCSLLLAIRGLGRNSSLESRYQAAAWPGNLLCLADGETQFQDPRPEDQANHPSVEIAWSPIGNTPVQERIWLCGSACPGANVPAEEILARWKRVKILTLDPAQVASAKPRIEAARLVTSDEELVALQ